MKELDRHRDGHRRGRRGANNLPGRERDERPQPFAGREDGVFDGARKRGRAARGGRQRARKLPLEQRQATRGEAVESGRPNRRRIRVP